MHSARAYVFAMGFALVCVGARPVQAMWPFTTTLARADSVSETAWEIRFGEWRERPIALHETTSKQSLSDSLRQVLEERNISVSPSELARMARMATKQTQRMAPPTPASPSGLPVPDTPPAAGNEARTKPDDDDPDRPPATPGDSSTSRKTDTGTADGSLAGSDPFAASGDTTTAAFGGEVPQDSIAVDGDDLALPNFPSPQGPAAVSAFAGVGVSPRYNSRFTSSNDRMNVTTSLATTVADVSGVSVTSTLSYGNNLSLTQNTETKNSGINNSLLFPLPRYGLNFNVTTTNRRSDALSRSLQDARTRNQRDDRGASLTGQGARDLMRGVRANAFYARRFSQNEQVILGSSSGSGDRANEIGGNSLGFGANLSRFRWIQARGRYGRAQSSNLDRSSSFVNDDNPTGEQESTSEGDSASVNLTIPRAGWFTSLGMDFQTRTTKESFTDVARTGTGGTGSSTDFELETKSNFSRSLRMRGTLSPHSALRAELAFGAARDSLAYAIRENQFRDEQRYDWSVGATLSYMTGGNIRVSYEEERNDINQDEPENPRNPQTKKKESRSLSFALNQSFTPTLNVRAYADIGLAQEFYAHEGPQGFADRDDFRTRLGLDIDGRISSKATGRVQMYMRKFDQAFIDPRRSFRSRNETEYVVRPSFVYNVTEDIVLEQFYSLSSKVLDEIYNPSRNTLNRNHSLQTTMKYSMTSHLELEARWQYLLQDNGFYVDNPFTPQEDRVFAPSARTKKDEIRLAMRYAVIKDGALTFTSENVATREHTGVRTTSVTERGNLALGLDSRITVGKLSLNTRGTRNQSFNATLNRNVFYNVDSSLSYAF